MSFVRGVSASPLYIRYIERLREYQIASSNFTEAGLTLKLHADLYRWDTSSYLDALSEVDLPRQSEFARKEALYLQILELLGKGKAWESAIELCKELQVQYEVSRSTSCHSCPQTRLFSYQRLSEVLAHQSTLYKNINEETRTFPLFFRVA